MSISSIRRIHDEIFGEGSYNKIKVSKQSQESEAEPEKLPFEGAPKTKLGPEAHERYTAAKKKIASKLGMPSSGWGLYGHSIVAHYNAWKKRKGKTEKAMKLVLDLNKARRIMAGDPLYKAGGPFIGPRGGKWADPQHKIPWQEKKHAGKPAPKAKEHDKAGARELQLHIENTAEFQNEDRGHLGLKDVPTQRGSIHRNLAQKMAAGKYDHAQAGKLFRHMVDRASKHYGSSKDPVYHQGGSHQFDVATRDAVARELADQFHDEAKAGEHDHHLSGVHAKRAPKGLAPIAKQHGKKAAAPKPGGEGGGKKGWTGKLRQDLPTFGKKGDPVSVTVRPDGHYEVKNTNPSAAAKQERGHNPVMPLHKLDFDPEKGDSQFKMD